MSFLIFLRVIVVAWLMMFYIVLLFYAFFTLFSAGDADDGERQRGGAATHTAVH